MTTQTQPRWSDAHGGPSRGWARIAAHLSTGVFAALMTASGVLYLASPPPIIAAMRALGYPAYFFKLLGVAKILGAAALIAPVPRTLREWAYAGFTFDLIAGAISHALTGGLSHALQPLVALGVLAVSYFSRRRAYPADRVQP